MYLSFYGLEKEPFNATPDPHFLFLSSSHKKALNAIVDGIEKRKGLVAVLGKVGVGKTTILRAYLERHSQEHHKTVYIFNPVLTYQELLHSILRGLNSPSTSNNPHELVTQLHEKLVMIYRSNSTVVVLIDEAQNMPVDTLKHLRMLSNLETSTDKLIQFILVGQPKLQAILNQPSLQQLQQRIAIQATITCLTPKESRAYIKHRIAQASNGKPHLFSRGAIQLICQHSHGIPRRINMICDNALRTGYDCRRKPVSTKMVKEIIGDGKTSKISRIWKWGMGIAAGILLALGIGPWQHDFMKKLIEIRTMLESKTFFPSTHVAAHHVPTDNTLSVIEKARDVSPNVNLLDSSLPQTFSNIVEEAPLSNTTADNQRPDDALPPKPVSQRQQKHPVSFEETVPQTIFPKVKMSKQRARRQDIYASSRSLITQTLQPSDTTTLSNQTQSVTTQNRSSLTIRSVHHGESLSEITQEVYGSTHPKYIRWVKKHNPQITDPDTLHIGQQLILPEFSQK